MDYFVIGEDGAEYGPANVATIAQWVSEGRVHPGTKLKDFQSGVVMDASSVKELFPPVASSPPLATRPNPGNPYSNPPTNYPRVGMGAPMSANTGNADVWWAIGRSVVAVVLAVASPGAGMFIAGWGVWRGVRAYKAQHRLGLVAMVVSIVAMVIVVSLFAYRMTQLPAQRSQYSSGSNE